MPQLKKGLFASLLSVSQRVIAKSVGLISTLVLARVLAPEDFGLVAMATIFFGFVSILGETGGQQYIVRAEEVNDEMLNTNWTINLILKVLISLITVLAAPLVASHFDDQRLVHILYFSAFATIIGGLVNPGINLLRRDQNIFPIVVNNLCGKVVAVSSAITIALIFESYWALIIGQFLSNLTRVIGSYFIHSYRPWFSLKNAREQYGFSIWLMAQASLGYARTQLDSFMVASGFTQSQLGQYNIMKYLAFLPNTLLLGPATGPLLRQLSAIKKAKNHFATSLNVSTFVSLLIALPVAIFLYVKSEGVVSILLGSQWTEYAYLFSLFALIIPAYVAFHQANRLMMIFDHTKHIFIYEIFAFVGIYSILYFVGLDDLIRFTVIRVSLENLFSFALLLYVTTTYTGLKNLIRTILLCIPLSATSLCGYLFLTQLPGIPSYPMIELLLHGSFFLVFFAILTLSYILLLRTRIKEFEVIHGYSRKVVAAIGKKPFLRKLIRNRS